MLSHQYNDKFGFVRDQRKVLTEWRNDFPFHLVQKIQESCRDVLQEMGYVLFSSEEELRNHSIPSYRPKSIDIN